jgi:hypothetical protein
MIEGAAPVSGNELIIWHLVMVRQPGWQSAEDFEKIAAHVRDIEPRIAVFVVRRNAIHSYVRRKAAARPSLIFSPGRLTTFRPLRGRLYQGRPIPKLEQIERLAAAGVSVPRTAILTPDLELDPALWGAYVVVKPTDLLTSSGGLGVTLHRTSRVRYIPPAGYPEDHPGRRAPMMVQAFVDPGERLASYRVLTLFGEPLYAQLNLSSTHRVDLAQPDEVLERSVVAIQAGGDRVRILAGDPDIIALARAAYAALPEVPLQGCDIMRDARTGTAYVVELNRGGNTWHFSSAASEATRRKYGSEFELERIRQFDAFRTAARVLVERTRAEAA